MNTPTPLRVAAVMAHRQLLHLLHAPEQLVDVTIQPVMLVVLFGYLFAHAFTVPGGDYLAYLMPGMVLQAIVFTASGIAVAVAADKASGFHDRTRTLPAPTWGVLLGRVATDCLQNALATVIMIAAGMAIGWRPHLSPMAAAAGIALVLSLGWAVAWAATALGLACRSAEAATGLTMLVILPLTFISDTFVPVTAMPVWIRPVATHNPVTHAVDALRGLPIHASTAIPHAFSLTVVALLVGGILCPLAVRAYER